MPENEVWESSERIKEMRRIKREKKIRRRKIFVVLLLFAVAFIGSLFTPVYNLKNIDVTGLGALDRERIIAASGLAVGENIFKFSARKIAEGVKTIPYVDRVSVSRKYPNTVIIEVVERKATAYLLSEDGTSSLIIDRYGTAIELVPEPPFYLPVIPDIKLKSYEIGEKVIVDNINKLEDELKVLGEIAANELNRPIKQIYKTENEYFITVDDITLINLGDGGQLSSKIAMLKEVLPRLPENTPGTVDASDSEKIYFKPNE